jgi:hypothetical protein
LISSYFVAFANDFELVSDALALFIDNDAKLRGNRIKLATIITTNGIFAERDFWSGVFIILNKFHHLGNLEIYRFL